MSESNKNTDTSTKPAIAAAPTKNPLQVAENNKWSLGCFPAIGKKKVAVVCIYSNTAADKPTKIGEGKGATIPEAFADAMTRVQSDEF